MQRPLNREDVPRDERTSAREETFPTLTYFSRL